MDSHFRTLRQVSTIGPHPIHRGAGQTQYLELRDRRRESMNSKILQLASLQTKGNLKMSSNSRTHYYSSAAATRPEISPEEEAEVCELPVNQVRELHDKLETSEPGPSRQKAMGDCINSLRIPLLEAAIILGVPTKDLSLRNYPIHGAFQHNGKWRIWMAAVRDLDENMKSSR